MLAPSQYVYETSAVRNADQESADCHIQNIAGTEYTFCNHPVRLTDKDPGPGMFDASDSSTYYRWNINGGRMMFVLPVAALLDSIRVFYYVDSTHMIGRPKIRVVLMDETFEINDTITSGHPDRILDIEFTGLTNGLKNESLVLQRNTDIGATTKVVLDVQKHKLLNLAISEITFCTTGMSPLPYTARRFFSIAHQEYLCTCKLFGFCQRH